MTHNALNPHDTGNETGHRFVDDMSDPYLKLELGTAEVGPLFLPEVVGFDDERDVDAAGERLLQDLQQRLDGVPLGATHVHDDREAMFTYVLARRRKEREESARERERDRDRSVLALHNPLSIVPPLSGCCELEEQKIHQDRKQLITRSCFS